MVIIWADKELKWEQVHTLKKIVTRLSFPVNQIHLIIKEAFWTDLPITDLHNFKRDIYKSFRIN